MLTSPLLARITLALSAASAVTLSVVACGDTTDGGGTGTGGSASSTNGGGGPGGVNAGGNGTACLRPLPSTTTSGTPCHDPADCAKAGGFATCLPPGKSSCDGMGGGRAPSCKTDEECASQGGNVKLLCQKQMNSASHCSAPCENDQSCGLSLACDAASGRCEPRRCETAACPAETYCTPAKECAYQRCNAGRSCGEGQSCASTDFSCVPTPCTGDGMSECPSSFACDAGSKVCTRRACACDTECPGNGYCAGALCYPTPGHCDGGCASGRPLLAAAGAPIVAPLLRGAGAFGGW